LFGLFFEEIRQRLDYPAAVVWRWRGDYDAIIALIESDNSVTCHY
jgi:hypothetical protein